MPSISGLSFLGSILRIASKKLVAGADGDPLRFEKNDDGSLSKIQVDNVILGGVTLSPNSFLLLNNNKEIILSPVNYSQISGTPPVSGNTTLSEKIDVTAGTPNGLGTAYTHLINLSTSAPDFRVLTLNLDSNIESLTFNSSLGLAAGKSAIIRLISPTNNARTINGVFPGGTFFSFIPTSNPQISLPGGQTLTIGVHVTANPTLSTPVAKDVLVSLIYSS